METLIRISALLAMMLFGLSFLAPYAAFFDSLSIFRPLYIIFILCTFWAFRPMYKTLLALGAASYLALFAFSLLPAPKIAQPNFRLYQHNLLFLNSAPDLELVTKTLSPDVLTLQEIRDAAPNISALRDYPYQQICKFAPIGRTGVISKYPFIQSGCSKGDIRGFSWAQIEIGGKLLTIVSMHLHWPYPHMQRQQVDEFIPELEALPRPIILAGDFNQTRWSYSVNRIAKAVDGEVYQKTIFTLIRPPLFLPIDHIISPFEMHVEKLDRYGSDHNGLYGEFLIK